MKTPTLPIRSALRLALAAAVLFPGTGEALAQGVAVSGAARATSGAPAAAGGAYGIYSMRRAAGSGRVEVSLTQLPGLSFPLVETSAAESAQALPSAPEAFRAEEQIGAVMAREGRIAAEQFRFRAASAPNEEFEGSLSEKGARNAAPADSLDGRVLFDRGRLVRDAAEKTAVAGAFGSRRSSGLRSRSGFHPLGKPAAVAAAAALTSSPAKAEAGAALGSLGAAKISAILQAAQWVPVAPLLYSAWRMARQKAKGEASEPQSAVKTFWESAETLPGLVVPLLGAGIASLSVSNPFWMGVLAAGAAFFAAVSMRSLLRTYRAVVVGGWQASHDQKYRVGYDGRLHDVRGHKYGADRYEKYAPGPVGPNALFWMRAVTAWLGLLFVAGSGAPAVLTYNLLLTALFFLQDMRAKPYALPEPVDAESAAHASRFSKSTRS